MEKSISFIRTK